MNLRYLFIFFLGAIACLYLAYSSAVTVLYVRNDGMRYFDKFGNANSDFATDPQYKWLCALGRPVAAVEEAFVYQKINHLSDLAKLKLFTIMVLALNASLLASIIVSLGFRAIPAFCISMAIFTLPGVQECVFVPFLSIASAQLLALLAYAIGLSRWPHWIRTALSFIFLEITFFTYVPMTFLFLIPTALVLILNDDEWQASKKIWARDMLLWVSAMVVYYIILRGFLYENLKMTHHQMGPSWSEFFTYIKTFLSQGAPQTFNLWNIYYAQGLGILVASFAVVVLAANFLYIKKKWWAQKAGALLMIFLIFNMIWFLFGGYLPRIFVASQAFAVILIYWCGVWFIKIFRRHSQWLPVCWPVAIMLMGLVCANSTMSRNVWNCNAELMFIRDRLAQYADTTIEEIHLIRPQDPTKGYNGLKVVYDNFNDGSTFYRDVPSLIRVALRDMDDPPTEMHCVVTSSDYGQPFKELSPHILVINMNDLVRISRDHLK